MLEQLEWPSGFLALIALGLTFWRPTLGFVAIIALYPLDPWTPRLPVPGLNVETILVGVLVALTVLRFGVRVPSLRFSGPVIAYVGVMFMGFIVAFPWARGQVTAIGDSVLWGVFKMFKSVTFTALLMICSYWWMSRPADRQRMLEWMSISVGVAALLSLVDWVIGINPESAGRAMGLFGDPNGMAQFCGAMSFASMYIYLRGDVPSWRRYLHLGIFGIAGLAVLFSLSRGNWVAFVVGQGVFLALVNRRALALAFAALVVVATVAFPLLPSVIRDRVTGVTRSGSLVYRATGTVGLEGSAASRIIFYSIGLRMFAESPIWGKGLHYFNYHSVKYGARYGLLRSKDAHSLPLKLAAEEGAMGVLMYLWVVGAAVLLGWNLWTSRAPEAMLGAVFLGMGAHVFVAGLAAPAFLYAKPISAFFWTLWGLTARTYTDRHLAIRAASEATP